MSALTGIAISFAWPLALGAIPVALGALVYLFRARGTTQSKVTSSLFLLARLPEYLPSRRRFVPPIQFWLELALAVALACAASGITFYRTGARVAVVIDTSKSMSARMSAGLNAEETRLQAALRIAKADIAQAPPDTLFKVLRAAGTISSAASDTQGAAFRAKGTAISELNLVRSTYEVDSLASVIADLRSRSLSPGGEYDSIWLYTDRTIEGIGNDSSFRVTTVPYDPDAARNIWISSIKTRMPNDAAKGAAHSPLLEVGVSRVGEGEDDVSVTATCSDYQSSTKLNIPPVTRRLAGRANSLIQLVPVGSSWSFCHVTISSQEDLMLQDNEGWIVYPRDQGEFGVISALAPQALGLDRLPYGNPVALKGGDAAAESKLRGILYHRIAPTTLPGIPALVIYPQIGVKLWGGLVQRDAAPGPGGSVEITRWDESHPLLQYVRPGLLALPTARVLECPITARPILFSADGALMCAGEERGRRYVIVGFELLPFDGVRTPTLSIVTLNTLQWLFSASGVSGAEVGFTGLTHSTGVIDLSAIDRGLDLQVQFIAPRNEQLASGSIRRVEVAEPGVLVVSDLKSTASLKQFIAVNALSDQESDLRYTTPISLAGDQPNNLNNSSGGGVYESEAFKPIAQLSDSRVNSRDGAEATDLYDRIFAWCALVIVALDLLRRIIGRHGWRESA